MKRTEKKQIPKSNNENEKSRNKPNDTNSDEQPPMTKMSGKVNAHANKEYRGKRVVLQQF